MLVSTGSSESELMTIGSISGGGREDGTVGALMSLFEVTLDTDCDREAG